MYSRTMITSVGRESYSSSEGYRQVSRGLWCCFHVPINVLPLSVYVVCIQSSFRTIILMLHVLTKLLFCF